MTYAQQAAARRPRPKRRPRLRWLLLAAAVLVAMAVFWHSGRPEIPAELRLYAAAHQISTTEYPSQLVDLYTRNPETRDFVFHYPENRGEEPAIDLSREAGDGEVPLLMQWDERWGYKTYAGDFFGLTGCGPTCLSMVALYKTGDAAMTPAWMADFASDHGYAVNGNGTAWALFTEGAAALGLSSRELPLDEATIAGCLESGQPVICIMGPGDFTTTGHFIVLTGWEDGAFRLLDPNSRENSEKVWPYGEISDQIRCLWAFS